MCEDSKTDPMSFLYIDMMANILLDTTKELEAEFNIKMEFIREQENTCLENTKQLIVLSEVMDKLRDCVTQTELELNQNEMELLEAEKMITNFESNSKYAQRPHPADMTFRYSSTLVLLKLLLSADHSMAQCNKLKDEIEHYNTEAFKRYEPCKTVGKILDYHAQSLQALESQINELERMTQEVARNYDEIKKDMKTSTLS
ncbi:hypothetical protein KR222_003368, partial [Zaprionus bogoriensis]